jgi:uncharacterized protein (DUF302 family)
MKHGSPLRLKITRRREGRWQRHLVGPVRGRSDGSNDVLRKFATLKSEAYCCGELYHSRVSPMSQGNGIVRLASLHSVDGTVERLKSILQSKGITLFAVIDHSGEAARVGLKMPDTKLVIFGNPRGGTPLMLASPSAAIDLPLKLLIAKDDRGTVWVSYNSPDYLGERHGLPESLLANVAVVQSLAAQVAKASDASE